MPADIEWKPIASKSDDKPSARSGHTMNWIGGTTYLLYGGIEDSKSGKIEPNTDLWTMKLGATECTWTKNPTPDGDKPLGRAQHVGLTTPADKQDRVFIFGGHHSP
jgi:hypothetical protein